MKTYVHIILVNSYIHFHWVYTKKVDLLSIHMSALVDTTSGIILIQLPITSALEIYILHTLANTDIVTLAF